MSLSSKRLFVVAGIVLTACASTPRLACRPGERPAVVDSLYFGTSRPGGQVTSEDWQRFLADVVTPRFSEGLTSWQAAGQWRNSHGEIEKEAAYVLHVVHPDGPAPEAAMQEVIETYKARFDQESVLRVRTPTCMSF